MKTETPSHQVNPDLTLEEILERMEKAIPQMRELMTQPVINKLHKLKVLVAKVERDKAYRKKDLLKLTGKTPKTPKAKARNRR